MSLGRRPSLQDGGVRSIGLAACQDDAPAHFLTELDPIPESSSVGKDVVEQSLARIGIFQLGQEPAGILFGRFGIARIRRDILWGNSFQQARLDGQLDPHPQLMTIRAGLML